MMQWKTQSGNLKNNKKSKLNFLITEFVTKQIMTWEFHINRSPEIRYNIILVRDIITEL